jgi:hypothetical protein
VEVDNGPLVTAVQGESPPPQEWHLIFKILIAVTIKFTVFWDEMPCFLDRQKSYDEDPYSRFF